MALGVPVSQPAGTQIREGVAVGGDLDPVDQLAKQLLYGVGLAVLPGLGLRGSGPVGRGRYGARYGALGGRGLMPRLQELAWIPTEQQWLDVLTVFRDEPVRDRLMPALKVASGQARLGVDIWIYCAVMTKILVSVDEKLLARIDQAARSAGLSRSAYLTGLARRELGEDRGPGAGRAARRALSRLDRLFGTHPVHEDATAAVRGDRDAH